MEFWVGAIVGLILNLISLYLPARKKIKKIFSNPAFVMGDFILIPLYFGFAAVFVQNNLSQLNLGVLLPAALIVVIYGRQFRLIKKVWLPHGLVAVFLVGILLLSLTIPPWPLPFALILLVNQLLGQVYLKKI